MYNGKPTTLINHVKGSKKGERQEKWIVSLKFYILKGIEAGFDMHAQKG